jgi:hypothetical protein
MTPAAALNPTESKNRCRTRILQSVFNRETHSLRYIRGPEPDSVVFDSALPADTARRRTEGGVPDTLGVGREVPIDSL